MGRAEHLQESASLAGGGPERLSNGDQEAGLALHHHPSPAQMRPPRSGQPGRNQGFSLFCSLCQRLVKRCDMFLPNVQ